MYCKSPDITNSTLVAEDDAPLRVDMHFRMDGVQELRDFPQTQPELSRFLYHVDPVFYPFSGTDNVRTFYEDESHLDIKVSKKYSLYCVLIFIEVLSTDIT